MINEKSQFCTSTVTTPPPCPLSSTVERREVGRNEPSITTDELSIGANVDGDWEISFFCVVCELAVVIPSTGLVGLDVVFSSTGLTVDGFTVVVICDDVVVVATTVAVGKFVLPLQTKIRRYKSA